MDNTAATLSSSVRIRIYMFDSYQYAFLVAPNKAPSVSVEGSMALSLIAIMRWSRDTDARQFREPLFCHLHMDAYEFDNRPRCMLLIRVKKVTIKIIGIVEFRVAV